MQNQNSSLTMTLPSEISSSQSSSTVFSYTVKSTRALDYADAARSKQFPKRDQGLIMDCVDGLNLTDYTCAVGEIVDKKNIMYSTRISNNRVCLYLTAKELINELTDKYKFIQIGETKVHIRPLIIKQQRVVFSNVAPPIPHYVLEDILDSLNIRRGAPITTLKASIAKDGYEHIWSSRRQAYIDPNDVSKLPELIKINYEDTIYYIYPSTASLKCFVCKMEGHIAKHCQNKSEPNEHNNSNQNHLSTVEITSNSPPVNTSESIDDKTLKDATVPKNSTSEEICINKDIHIESNAMLPPIGTKRSPSSNISTTNSENSTKLKKMTKKIKAVRNIEENVLQASDLTTQLLPVMNLIK